MTSQVTECRRPGIFDSVRLVCTLISALPATLARLLFLLPAVLIARMALAQDSTITEYPIPTANSVPTSIIGGPDGNLWFDESYTQKIGRITAAGAITEFETTSSPVSIVVGPDGNIWFTEIVYPVPAIAKMTPAGVLSEFRLSNPFSGPLVLTPGPDGNLWFTEYDTYRIGRITPAGSIAEFSLPDDERPTTLVAAADGNLWFTTLARNNIGKIDAAGAISEFSLSAAPGSLVNGPDGEVWFGESSYSCVAEVCTSANGKVGKISSAGTVLEFPIPSGETPALLAKGPDGNLWFTEYDFVCQQFPSQPGTCTSTNGRLGKITSGGVVTEYSSFAGDKAPTRFFTGPDGNLWFTETANRIGKITPAGAIDESPIPVAGNSLRGVTTGPDGNLWFVDPAANGIGKITLSAAPVKIDGYMSGNWYDPAQSGQGFELEFASEANTAVAIWFTFAPDGSGQRWIYAQGRYDSTKSSVTLPAVLPTGAKFPPNFKATDVTNLPWGTITFDFSGCDSGTATWNSTVAGYGSGSLPITRLTSIQGTACP